MREKEIVIGHVYSSPSLRCVETASSLLEGEQIGPGHLVYELQYEKDVFLLLWWWLSSWSSYLK